MRLFLLISIFLFCGCLSAKEIKIKLFYLSPPATANFSCLKGRIGKTAFTELSLKAEKGKISADFSQEKIKANSFEISCEPAANIKASGKDRQYKGKFFVSIEKGKLNIINLINMEDYLPAVISSELRGMKKMETYKAQAVVSRTYILAAANRHAISGYNFCDSTHCQLYQGQTRINSFAEKAVKETTGEILTYKNAPIWAFYHSICAGRTEKASDVWPYENKPYLLNVKDGPQSKPYCYAAPNFFWRTKIDFQKFKRFAMKKIFKADLPLKEVKLLRQSDSQRISTIIFVSSKKSIKIPATDFYHICGKFFGWDSIRSTDFHIRYDKKYIIFEGKGHGHGVGMCQYGAEGMARLGYDYKRILLHYFKNVQLTRKKL